MQSQLNMRRLVLCSTLLIMVLATAAGFYLHSLYREVAATIASLPKLSRHGDLTTELFDRYGDKIADLSGDHRYPLAFEALPPFVLQAFMSAEDKYFFQHRGVNPLAMLRALWINTRDGRWVQGASTMTQQLTRILFLSHDKSLKRKIKEIYLALALERVLTKSEIATLYLNSIYFGNRAYGLAAASSRYFGKPPQELSLAEAALLAGVIRAPSYYAPHRHRQRAKKRQQFVLAQMQANGYLTPNAAQQWDASPLALLPVTHPPRSSLGFLRDAVGKELARKFELRHSGEGGFAIAASFDKKLQRAAQQALMPLSGRLPPAATNNGDRVEAALITLSRKTGAILAVQGSANYATSQFNRAFYTARPIAGLILPFLLAVALEQGYSAYTPLSDDAIADAPRALPPPSLYDLLHSQDLTAALDIVPILGMGSLQQKAFAMGLSFDPSAGLDLTGFRASPLQVAVAYSSFFNGGLKQPPYTIAGITNSVGQTLYKKSLAHLPRVLQPEVAFVVQELLKETPIAWHDQAMATRGEPIAGLITMTSDLKNAWFAGASGSLVHVLWLGAEYARMPIAGSASALVTLVTTIMQDYVVAAKEVEGAKDRFLPAPPGRVSFGRVTSTPRQHRKSSRHLLPFTLGRELPARDQGLF